MFESFYIGLLLYIAWLTFCQRADDGWKVLRKTFRVKYPERKLPDLNKKLNPLEDNLKNENKFTGIFK